MKLGRIEMLLGESLPDDIEELFARYDGDEEGGGAGSFLGHSPVSLDRAIDSLEFSRNLIKPVQPIVADPDAAQAIVAEMLKVQLDALGLSDIGRGWHKLEFQCGPRMFGGPYLYRSPSAAEVYREVPGIPSDCVDQMILLAARLHEQEKAGYNWDELQVIAFADGRRIIERSFYDFNGAERRVWPQGAIKNAYFHAKWCPVIDDYGGNFIGVDLDPGPSGSKGQVIVFGRDETLLYVLAETWEAFLDLLLARISAGGAELLGDLHLHDLLQPSQHRSDPPNPVL